MNLIRSEWTKLWSVRRWVLAMLGAVVLTAGLSMLAASGSGADANEYPNFVVSPDGKPVHDEFHFVRQQLSGDGSITARVFAQENSHEWAGAGVLVKDGISGGSGYAALMVTPAHGIRLSANYTTEIAGGEGDWLRLARTGTTVTAFASPDGVTWREIGAVEVPQLKQTVEIGLFVNSPPIVVTERAAGSTSVGQRPTMGQAKFDNVEVAPATGQDWQSDDLLPPPDPRGDVGGPMGESTEQDGVFTLAGTGQIAPSPQDDDVVQISLFGVLAGLIVLGVVGVLFVTAEFKRGMIRTTFAATPRRGRVLAAKAVVLGVVAYGVGLIAGTAAFLLAQPTLRANGFGPPAFPIPSLTDPEVIRVLLTTSAFLAGIALLGLALGAVLRHSAAAITAVVVLVVLPGIVGTTLPATPARLLMLLTPAGGLATQRAKPPTLALVEPWSMISPWAGLAVVFGYVVAALAGAWWLLRRRDA